MPRTNINYTNTSIYKLCCKNLNISDIYVGHTTNMRKRKWQHKTACNNEKNKKYNYDVYQFIRANGGFDNFDMIEIERFEAIDGNDARKKERYYIETLKATLNITIPTRTCKEWREENKEILYEKAKEKYEKNKESILEKAKEKYEKNKESIIEYQNEYYNNNKENISEKHKEKITCECGSLIRKSDLARHKQSKKHINLIRLG
jgi:predicted GIY-YIG superfamily endonuclease